MVGVMPDNMKAIYLPRNHEHKIVARTVMCAIDLRMKDSTTDRNGLPWMTLTHDEARSFALDLLFLSDRELWLKAVDQHIG